MNHYIESICHTWGYKVIIKKCHNKTLLILKDKQGLCDFLVYNKIDLDTLVKDLIKIKGERR